MKLDKSKFTADISLAAFDCLTTMSRETITIDENARHFTVQSLLKLTDAVLMLPFLSRV